MDRLQKYMLLAKILNVSEKIRSPFNGMMELTSNKSRRSSSWDRSGKNRDWIVIAPKDIAELLNINKAGCIRHIYWDYITREESPWNLVREHLFRNCILRMYWDGELEPSVECPLGDFFGVANGIAKPFWSLMITINQGSHLSSYGFNSYFPMPFKTGARIEVENDSDTSQRIWYHVDYEQYDVPPMNIDGLGRFHAQWQRKNPTLAVDPPEDFEHENLDGHANYEILNAEGMGNLAGYILTVDNIVGGWYGEGDDMIFIDGEKWPPSIHGTGTEEIFGGGAGPSIEYDGPYTGFHVVSNFGGEQYSRTNSMYRFFVNDPIHFQKSIKVTIEHGHANALANDYSSVAFWYQKEPHSRFPHLPKAKQRKPREQKQKEK